MEVKREHAPWRIETPRFRVSILVLMEVKREQLYWVLRLRAQNSFNPCFDGSEARERRGAHSKHRATMFQSLF